MTGAGCDVERSPAWHFRHMLEGRGDVSRIRKDMPPAVALALSVELLLSVCAEFDRGRPLRHFLRCHFLSG